MYLDARRVALRLALFALPFLAYIGLILVVDPYNFFSNNGSVDQELKRATSRKLNDPLWRILDFHRHPAPHILLGDSRVMGLNAEAISARTGTQVANLGYGGGSLREAIDTFWIAAEETELTRVTIGVGFSNYNAANDKNRVSEVRSILHNPLLYFTNLSVIDATGRILRSLLTRRPPAVGKPPMTPEAFWRHQIEVTTRLNYESWRSPDLYRQELGEVAEYCQTHGIQLEFIIPPGHRDLQVAVADYGLSDEYSVFKAELSALALVHDFDEINEFTEDANHFKDPYHLKLEHRLELIEGVWGRGSEYVRTTPRRSTTLFSLRSRDDSPIPELTAR